jgi:hypothetical protein
MSVRLGEGGTRREEGGLWGGGGWRRGLIWGSWRERRMKGINEESWVEGGGRGEM